MTAYESRAQGPAPESTARTTKTSVQAGSAVSERCRYTDAVCRCDADEPNLDDCREAFAPELVAKAVGADG